MYTDSSAAKKRFKVPSSCDEVEQWMKLSLASSGDTGRLCGNGEGGGVDAGTILYMYGGGPILGF